MAFTDYSLKYYKSDYPFGDNYASEVIETGTNHGIEVIHYTNPSNHKYYYIYCDWDLSNDKYIFKYCAKIDDEIYQNLTKLRLLGRICYSDSFDSFPAPIRRFINNTICDYTNCGNFANVELIHGCICINTFVIRPTEKFHDIVYKDNCVALLKTISEIKTGYIQLNKSHFDKLNFKPKEIIDKELRTIPKWVGKAVGIGAKVAIRLGAAFLGGWVGANLLSNQDFDFDIDRIDFGGADIDLDGLDFTNNIGSGVVDSGVDFDYDFDIDSGYDTGYEIADNSVYNFSSESSGYNVSFGAQDATLKRSGGGLGSLDVTITKEPGSSNLFCITDGTHTIHNVPGGTNNIKIDGIKYILPKLKG